GTRCNDASDAGGCHELGGYRSRIVDSSICGAGPRTRYNSAGAARHGELRDLVQRRGTTDVQSRRRAAAFLRVLASCRCVQRAILDSLFAKHRDHPGLAHYIIHNYDVPPLADRALEAAQRYSKIAPSAPHALHMPSHTFTRVGYWQESIDANIASAESARIGKATAEELHANDYQAYADLQTAQDSAARRLVDALPDIASR